MSERRIYHRLLERAKALLKDQDKIRQLLINVGERLKKVSENTEESKSTLSEIKMMVRMVRAHVTGAYRAFSPVSLLMFVFALVYFITPIDVLPDFIPALGFTDDLTVVLLILKRFSADVEKYRTWEQTNLT